MPCPFIIVQLGTNSSPAVQLSNCPALFRPTARSAGRSICPCSITTSPQRQPQSCPSHGCCGTPRCVYTRCCCCRLSIESPSLPNMSKVSILTYGFGDLFMAMFLYSVSHAFFIFLHTITLTSIAIASLYSILPSSLYVFAFFANSVTSRARSFKLVY